MILFKNDFLTQRAYVHDKTKNTSFIRMSVLLQKMGIKNYLFPLALYQKELENVDPHKPETLTPEIAKKIALEIKINPWYYFREVIRIPATGSKSVPYRLNRGGLAMIWSYYNNIDVASTQPRQTGKTITAIGIATHVHYFVGQEFTISMLAKDAPLVHSNVEKFKNIRDALPQWLLTKSTLDTDNKEGISYFALKNRYVTYVNANDERNAYRIGRGGTTSFLHWDEIAYFNFIWITYTSVLSSTDAAVESAKAAGMPYANILTTTAGRPDTEPGAYAANLFNGACRFHESLYDCENREQLLEVVSKNSHRGNLMVYCVFSHRQLGFTDEWLRSKIVRSNGDCDDIERDYLNIWKSGSDNSVLNQKTIDAINKSKVEPVWVENKDNYLINWYIDESLLKKPEYKYRTYIAGMDSSEMVGQDYTTLVVIDPYDMGVVATMRCNESNILHLGNRLAQFMVDFPKVVLIPESKSTGRSIMDIIIDRLLKEGQNPWMRIFNQAVQRRSEALFRGFDIYNTPLDGMNRKLFGYATSGGNGPQSRNMLYKTVMNKALGLNHDRIYDENLVREFCTLTVTKTGKVDHLTKNHDDMVIAYLLACYLAFFGNNLHLYGIDTDNFLNQAGQDKDAKTKQTRLEQIELRQRISVLEDRIRRCPTELIKYSYVRELTNLTAMLDPDVNLTDPIAITQINRDDAVIGNKSNVTSVAGVQTLQNLYQNRIVPSGFRYARAI